MVILKKKQLKNKAFEVWKKYGKWKLIHWKIRIAILERAAEWTRMNESWHPYLADLHVNNSVLGEVALFNEGTTRSHACQSHVWRHYWTSKATSRREWRMNYRETSRSIVMSLERLEKGTLKGPASRYELLCVRRNNIFSQTLVRLVRSRDRVTTPSGDGRGNVANVGEKRRE